MPQPLFRFVAIAFVLLFWQCQRQLPYIILTGTVSEGLKGILYFLLCLKKLKSFLDPLKSETPSRI